MIRKIKHTLLLAGFSFFCIACATIDYTSMSFDTDIKSQKILNLKNCGILTSSTAIDIIQADKIVKNGFLNTGTNEYGFYHINFEFSKDTTTGGAFLGALNIYTFAIPTLIGIPLTIDKYIIKVNFEIFDSNGILIKKYQEQDTFKDYKGLYYGHTLNKKANKKYIQLLMKIMEYASNNSAEINRKLSESGQITNYDQDVLNKIYMYIAQQYSTIQFSEQISFPGYPYIEKKY